MGIHHLVRVGALGRVGRFTAIDAVRYPRHARVIVRTSRGLELGEILDPPNDGSDGAAADGSILRGMTVEDRLLQARLEVHRREAFNACNSRLDQLKLTATLIDVEHLFDGRTLLFYFLGEVTPELEAVTDELAEVYEAQVQIRRFTDTVNEGCGPGCGTEEATGGGCKTCVSGCPAASACAARAG